MSGWLTSQLVAQYKGGPGSGNWGHAGVKGRRGGSAPKSGTGAMMSLSTGPTAKERQEAARAGGKKPTEKKPLTPEEHAQKIMNTEKVTDDFYIFRAYVPETNTDVRQYEKVKGKRVKVPGSENLDLFIHRPLRTQYQEKDFTWTVSEGRTGVSLGLEFETQKELKQAIEKFLSKKTPESFLHDVEKILAWKIRSANLTLLSPRYGGIANPE